MSQDKIQSLSDLLELAIKLTKTGVPNGFITTVWVSKEVRLEIYKELLNNNIDNEFWEFKHQSSSGYSFKVLSYNFFIISNNI